MENRAAAVLFRRRRRLPYSPCRYSLRRLLAGRHFAEQHAAFGFRSLRRLDQRDRDLLGRGAGVLDHRSGDIFDEATLLLELATFQNVDDDFRH
jgi:hypothetical protein